MNINFCVNHYGITLIREGTDHDNKAEEDSELKIPAQSKDAVMEGECQDANMLHPKQDAPFHNSMKNTPKSH